MAVPEATLDLNNCGVARQDNVRASGQFADMQTEPMAKTMQHTPNEHLRLRVFRPNF
jgi:hypothetical protein